MTTVISPELSKKNKYHIPKHRYYELKHFCLQYNDWKKAYSEIEYLRSSTYDNAIFRREDEISNPTYELAEQKLLYFEKMKVIEQTAIATDPELSSYILKAVTNEVTYVHLKSKLNIPCGRGTYYDRYRRFFWLLDKAKY